MDYVNDEDEIFDDSLEEQQVVEGSQDEGGNDLTADVLAARGIADPSKIKFEDESGNVVERAWDDLTHQEQVNILTDLTDPTAGLDNEEIELINAIRQSGGSVRDYLDSLQPQQLPQQTQSYKIDELSDDEVYALDLMEKVENITDEEITQQIEIAKLNPDMYDKVVRGLRSQYIKLQQDNDARVAEEQQYQQQQLYQQFSSTIANEINNLNSFGGQELELSDDDRNQLYGFMCQLDQNGMSEFGRALNDPQVFTEAAFWILKKNEILDEIDLQLKMNYQRGYQAAKNDLSKGKNPVVFKQKPAINTTQLFDSGNDDDSWLA